MSGKPRQCKASQYLVEYEAWSEQHGPGELETFLRQQEISPELKDEIREILKLEADLFHPGQRSGEDELSGQQIGNYRIREKLGAGGMATVWLAEQLQPVQRSVAIKILSSGHGSRSDELVQRLEKESQVLAHLSHPNIAKVYDAGRIKEDVPFFVMDYIDGESITDYCNRHFTAEQKNSLRNRLRLFLQLCDGIQHVHQKSLLHRDIKPSNVMVTCVDGEPHVKVIDLGLAKVLQGSENDRLEITNGIGVVGSPLWMSPEQVVTDDDSDSIQIDTRSDIYSMGALLYELVTGTSPLEPFRNSSSKFELLKAVVEVQFDRPSVRLAKVHARQTDFDLGDRVPFPWTHRLKNDLDWVVMKALAKDRDLRYSSVGELKQDIVRFLKSEPVLARPPSMLYGFSKLVQKNVVASASMAVMFIGLALTSIFSIYALANERRAIAEAVDARDEAIAAKEDAVAAKLRLENEREFNRQLLDANAHSFGLLNVSNPGVESDAFKRQFLIDKKTVIDKIDWSSSPGKELAFRKNLADSLAGGGFESQAIEEYRRVAVLSEQVHGAESLPCVNAQIDLADALIGTRRLKEAQAVVRRCSQIAGRLQDIDEACDLKLQMATFSLEAFPDLKALGNLVSAAESQFGHDSKLYVRALSLFADAAFRQGATAESLKASKKAWDIAEKVYGNHRMTMNLKLAYWEDVARDVGVSKVSTPEIQAFVSGVQQKFGDRHPFSLKAEKIETEIKFRRNEIENLVETYENLISKFESQLGPDHSECVILRLDAAENFRRRRMFAKSIEYYESCLPGFERLFGAESAQHLGVQQMFSKLLIFAGQSTRGYQIATRFLPVAEKSLGDADRTTLNFRESIGMCAFSQGKPKVAEEMFLACIRDTTDEFLKSNYLMRLAQHYSLLNDLDRSIKSVEEAIEIRKRVLTKSSSDTVKLQSHLLTALLQAKRFDRAEEVANELLAIVKPGKIYTNGIFYHAQVTRAECLVERRAYREAIESIKSMRNREGYQEVVDSMKRQFNPANPCYALIELRATAALGRCEVELGNEEAGKLKIEQATTQFRAFEQRVGSRHGLDWYRERLEAAL